MISAAGQNPGSCSPAGLTLKSQSLLHTSVIVFKMRVSVALMSPAAVWVQAVLEIFSMVSRAGVAAPAPALPWPLVGRSRPPASSTWSQSLPWQ